MRAWRAVTVKAGPGHVWPWVAQVRLGRRTPYRTDHRGDARGAADRRDHGRRHVLRARRSARLDSTAPEGRRRPYHSGDDPDAVSRGSRNGATTTTQLRSPCRADKRPEIQSRRIDVPRRSRVGPRPWPTATRPTNQPGPSTTGRASFKAAASSRRQSEAGAAQRAAGSATTRQRLGFAGNLVIATGGRSGRRWSGGESRPRGRCFGPRTVDRRSGTCRPVVSVGPGVGRAVGVRRGARAGVGRGCLRDQRPVEVE
jgi:hypothetical protein